MKRENKFNLKKLLFVAIIVFLASGWTENNKSATAFSQDLSLNHANGESGQPIHPEFIKQEGWQSMRWSNKSSSTDGSGKAMAAKVEDILKILQSAAPLNPPRGMGVYPRGEFLKRVTLPGDATGPEPVRLQLGFRIPADARQAESGVNLWINDPHNLLGEPVLTDKTGEIYLMPPLVGTLAGQTIISRSAHPAGYKEEYPSSDLFPLWGNEQEPFLRSVVRPTFGLAKSTVTTMFTAGGRPFWAPVSQERWIMAMIEKANMELAEFQAGVEAAGKTDITNQQINQMRDYLRRMRAMYDEKAIIERYDKLREEFKKTFSYMESMNPGEGKKQYEQMIEQLDSQLELELASAPESRAELQQYEDKLLKALVTREDIWTGADVSIRGGDWDGLEGLGKEYELENLVLLADAGRARDRLQAELNSLSPAQRRSPAWGFELPPWHPVGPHRHVVALPFDAVRPSGLVEPGTEGARALVSIDTGFFTFVEKDAPIKLLAVEWWGRHDTRYGSGGRLMLNDLWGSLSWSALRAMVE